MPRSRSGGAPSSRGACSTAACSCTAATASWPSTRSRAPGPTPALRGYSAAQTRSCARSSGARSASRTSRLEHEMTYDGRWETVRVSVEERIAWVELHRPEKRNAMNPKLNSEMIEVLEALDADDDAGVLVLTGAGDAFSAGMDLKEYFREVDAAPAHVQRKVRRDNGAWQIRMLRGYAKPTIAMVNGWCFGGAFIPLVACDLAVAAHEATFGLSEINWGIPPGSVVSRALAETIGSRNALLYIMTGRTFDGRRAAEMGLVNWSTQLASLRGEVA